ncbi:hypothetical protein Acr_28g0010560 [Actinidia rufa]|uniref:Uncharacterized protein n=1 Tax=Actinidia rufa TaxID=165716 RepID=A0A7J0HBJ4_9ERIC|nr:hypothetical protein Acr_28g0010560 [Actinidia rufa]
MDNLRGGELGTHGSSGSSLPMGNLRRESSELEELGKFSPNGQPSWGKAWYLRELGSSLLKEKLHRESSKLGEFGELSPNGQPSWGRAWYSRELEKLSPKEKISSGELEAGRALSKWKTFVGRAGTHGSSGSSLPKEKFRRESSLQMDNLHGGELGTHGSSRSSLPMENLRLESSELGEFGELSIWTTFVGESLVLMGAREALSQKKLRRESSELGEFGELSPNGQPSWGKLGIHESSGSSLPNGQPSGESLVLTGALEALLKEKISSGELGAGRALSKWTTFMGESLVLTGAWKALSNGKLRGGEPVLTGAREALSQWKNFVVRSSELGELYPNGQPSWGSLVLTRAQEALSQWKTFVWKARSWRVRRALSMDNFCGGELGTHETREALSKGKTSSGELGLGEHSFKWTTLWEKLGTHGSSGSSLPVETFA